MFTVGDKVLYPMHGAAVIKDVEKRQVNGRPVNYFILDMLLSDMKVMIPEVNVNKIGLRPIVNKQVMPEVEDVLKARPENVMKKITWNRRYNLYVDKMKTGDIFQVADVVRTCPSRKMTRNCPPGSGACSPPPNRFCSAK